MRFNFLCACCFGKVESIGGEQPRDDMIFFVECCRMRGWVGVGKEVVKKMAGLLTASGFTGIFAHHPSAPLAQTGFQRFVCQSTKTFHAMIASSAILNLANLIQTSSLASAVEISLTPY